MCRVARGGPPRPTPRAPHQPRNVHVCTSGACSAGCHASTGTHQRLLLHMCPCLAARGPPGPTPHSHTCTCAPACKLVHAGWVPAVPLTTLTRTTEAPTLQLPRFSRCHCARPITGACYSTPDLLNPPLGTSHRWHAAIVTVMESPTPQKQATDSTWPCARPGLG